MTSVAEPHDLWVLRPEIVRWSLDELAQLAIHPYFMAYLHLRERAIADGDREDIQPRWDALETFMRIPGGPNRRNNYRPFKQSENGKPLWMNDNLAGSYAPSSIRGDQPPSRVVNVYREEGRRRAHIGLLDDHARLALTHLLRGNSIPVVPWSVWLFRDFGFRGIRQEVGWMAPVTAFRETFRFDQGDAAGDFGVLFSVAGEFPSGEWFEPFNDDEAAE